MCRTMKKLFAAVALVAALSAFAVPAFAGGAVVVPEAIWAEGYLFGTVATPAGLPDQGEFDALYNFDGSGLSGQRSISESKPGDTDYNGGRWRVYAVTFTQLGKSVHDPDKDGVVNFELTSEAQLMTHAALGHLTIGTQPVAQFVCPLRSGN